jgi:protein-S-isoprenylcysteine O-methyltransferase
LVLGVVFADYLLALLTPGHWNHPWLFAIGCWAVLNGYWALANRKAKPVLSSPILWFVSVAEFLLYALPLSSLPLLGQRLAPRYTSLEVVGAAMCAFGVAFAIWARHVLAGSWNNVATLQNGHALVQHGPYALIRHPIYFGFMTSTVGLILVLPEVRALVLLTDIVFCFRKMKPEEKILRDTYPNDYPVYEQRVKRLLPCIW